MPGRPPPSLAGHPELRVTHGSALCTPQGVMARLIPLGPLATEVGHVTSRVSCTELRLLSHCDMYRLLFSDPRVFRSSCITHPPGGDGTLS